ncbi:MAG: HNH endonuclease [Bacteroidetes bacterium]|nr:HNH endonuclease [Bacteroidota bacterium]MBS1929900.1 HNH endonuclease [Bacteroidota bacterium]
MTFYLGVTDNNWFTFLADQNREDVNFWQPGGNTNFKLLQPGAPFLFKLKSPINAIGGIGFFSSHTFLPISFAWEVFNNGNGCNSLQELKNIILPLRRDRSDTNPQIGCIVLTNPIFFKKEDWIPAPYDWSKSIVQGKSYSTDTTIGNELWTKIERLLQKYLYQNEDEVKSQLLLEDTESPMYGKLVLNKVRLGQSAFRILVTDAYNRKCSISGEKTLPVLEAAHIKPYAESGSHIISNALLLRSDLHKLFDTGYLTITSDLKVEISKRIKEEFENGREYYKFHGSNLFNLPNRIQDKPGITFIKWHNENIYKG